MHNKGADQTSHPSIDAQTYMHLCCPVTGFLVMWLNYMSRDVTKPMMLLCAQHLPSLIRIFAVRMKKSLVLSYQLSAQRRFWSDWADAQADLSLGWARTHFVGFVVRRHNYMFDLFWKAQNCTCYIICTCKICIVIVVTVPKSDVRVVQ